ncbi:MAG: NYN domain-containing protein [Elusimicrobiota bacterium]
MDLRTIVLIDGENLYNRYKACIDSGSEPATSVTCFNNFVWAPGILHIYDTMEILRVSYYNTFVGSLDELEALNNKISKIGYEFTYEQQYSRKSTIVPRIFKKENRSKGTKSVDINISIDALRSAYNDTIDRLILVSGDGDYIPLIEEVMRQNVQVYVGALSSGLNPQLESKCDKFYNLDKVLLK